MSSWPPDDHVPESEIITIEDQETTDYETRNSETQRETCVDDEEYLAGYIASKRIRPSAPPLTNGLRYHVLFIFDESDNDWLMDVVRKLESPALGFKCCCQERDNHYRDLFTRWRYDARNAITYAKKTVLVLSPEFLIATWSDPSGEESVALLSETDLALLGDDIILLQLDSCQLPRLLLNVPSIDCENDDDWWATFVAKLQYDGDASGTEIECQAASSSLSSTNLGLRSGELLFSIKSKCRSCGKEIVDAADVPEAFVAHGIQISPEACRSAIKHLMSDSKFRCHVICYNVPFALMFFILLLVTCLAVGSLIEKARSMRHHTNYVRSAQAQHTGIEMLHAGLVWLVALTVYVLVMQISKKKMKLNTYKRLSYVNSLLMKYNILAGVENLGLADCNKYYLHFFYFEIGPCLANLQEAMTSTRGCDMIDSHIPLDVSVSDGDCDVEMGKVTDQARVMGDEHFTNMSMQNEAENLMLRHSGEYVSLLVTKKLARPRQLRHLQSAQCLCQFVENRAYKMVV